MCTLVGNVEDVDENVGSFVVVCVDDLTVDGVASKAPVTIPVLLCFGLRVDDNVGNVDIRVVFVFVDVSVILEKVSDANLEATPVVELKGVYVVKFFVVTSDVVRARLEVESVTVFSNDLVVVTVDVRNVRCLEVFAD